MARIPKMNDAEFLLLVEQAKGVSDLKAFLRERGVLAPYFYSRRKKLLKSVAPEIAPESLEMPRAKQGPPMANDDLLLSHRGIEIIVHVGADKELIHRLIDLVIS